MNTQEYNPVQTTPYGIGYKIKSRIWILFNATIFRLTPFFMRRTRVFFLRMFGANIDWKCSVSNKAKIIDPWNLTMGELSSLGDDSYILCRGKVIIGEKCCIGVGANLLSGSHNIYSPNFELTALPIRVDDKVWIATKAIITQGTTIGEGCVVAAGSVVVKSVADWNIVGGNPAIVIKRRNIQHQATINFST